LQKFDIVTLFLGVSLGIQKFRARNPVYREVDSCIKNALKLTYHLEHQKKFRGLRPLDPQGREGKKREGKGTEGKRRMCPPRENPAYATGGQQFTANINQRTYITRSFLQMFSAVLSH
jgi:hypothetical protein